MKLNPLLFFSSNSNRSFRLCWHFSLVSLAGILVVVTSLTLSYRYIAFSSLEEQMTKDNVALANALATKLWPRYASFVAQAPQLPRESLIDRAETKALHAEVLRETSGLPVVKVKLYHPNGLTVFSTETQQIGEDKRKSYGVQRAARGEVVSEIVFRNNFYNLENMVADRNLLTSYVPVRSSPEEPASAVFELYTDITPLVDAVRLSQRKIVASVIGILALLYLFLYLLVRRADRILAAQEAERLQHVTRIRHQTYNDALTGLPNRASFAEHLDAAIKRAEFGDRLLGVLLLDVDRFKVVNDSLGHDAGDELLRRVSERIAHCARHSDTTFRMGGDEFTVILEDLDGPEAAGIVARRILDALTEPLYIGEREIVMSASIGIAIYPKDAKDIDMLVKGADAAMYRAKEAGRNTYEFFTHEMNALAMQRLALQTDLQRALKRDEFLLYYQPRASLIKGTVTGVEALLRWHCRHQQILTPDKFLPYLEESGLIVPVGDWVLRTACHQCRAWQDAGVGPLRVSVNISSRQFRSGKLADSVRAALAEAKLDPSLLELEITESMLVDSTSSAIQILEELKTIGVSISIDDFGSGYSSLNYLKRFPVDILKIDRSFVSDLATSEKDAAIIATITTLARNLNLGVVAEGVETQHQLDFLRRHECDEIQGYLLSRPVPPESIPDLACQWDWKNKKVGKQL